MKTLFQGRLNGPSRLILGTCFFVAAASFTTAQSKRAASEFVIVGKPLFKASSHAQTLSISDSSRSMEFYLPHFDFLNQCPLILNTNKIYEFTVSETPWCIKRVRHGKTVLFDSERISPLVIAAKPVIVSSPSGRSILLITNSTYRFSFFWYRANDRVRMTSVELNPDHLYSFTVAAQTNDLNDTINNYYIRKIRFDGKEIFNLYDPVSITITSKPTLRFSKLTVTNRHHRFTIDLPVKDLQLPPNRVFTNTFYTFTFRERLFDDAFPLVLTFPELVRITDNDKTLFDSEECTVHGTKMTRRRFDFGSFSPGEELEKKSFPNSGVLTGLWCAVGLDRFIKRPVYVCENCRKAFKVWTTRANETKEPGVQ